MRTKIFFTTLLLFVGLITNAQIKKDNWGSKNQEQNNTSSSNNKKTTSGNLLDASDNYSGKTKLIEVTNDVYFLKGVEENMGVILTDRGVVLIDTQIEEEMIRSLKIVNRLDKKSSIKYLITTSNIIKNSKPTTKLKKDGTIFLAQNIKAKRKPSKNDFSRPNFKADLVFNDQIRLNFEGKKIEVIPLNNSGNSAVYLTNKNVLFTGPIYSYKKYPEVNAEKGKSFKVISSTLGKLSSIANENTKIVPGQGDIARQIDLVNMKKMLDKVSKQVTSLRENGKTLEEVLVNKNITKNYDAQGYGDGAITREIFITSIYNEIAKKLGALDTRTPEEKTMAKFKEMQKKSKLKESKN
jgi:cyclase